MKTLYNEKEKKLWLIQGKKYKKKVIPKINSHSSCMFTCSDLYKIGLRNLYRRGPRLHFECRANAVVIYD